MTEAAMDIKNFPLSKAKEGLASQHELVATGAPLIDSFTFLQLIMKTLLLEDSNPRCKYRPAWSFAY